MRIDAQASEEEDRRRLKEKLKEAFESAQRIVVLSEESDREVRARACALARTQRTQRTQFASVRQRSCHLLAFNGVICSLSSVRFPIVAGSVNNRPLQFASSARSKMSSEVAAK